MVACCGTRARRRSRGVGRLGQRAAGSCAVARADPGCRHAEGRGQAAAGHLRRRDARHGLPDEAERPELVRRAAADEAAVLRRPVRRGRPLLRRGPSEPPRVQGLHAHEPGRAQDDLRVRAVRHRRRRRPDDVPPAPRLGRARPDRGGPDLEPVHGPRRLPELDRVLGPERHGVLPQRAVPVDAVAERRLELHGRAGAAGGQRRPGDLRRAHRARGRQGSLPAARTSRRTSARRAAGATSRWPACCGRSSGTT